jgi:glucosyl-dolichyl phosphate glucuronosyltransferase
MLRHVYVLTRGGTYTHSVDSRVPHVNPSMDITVILCTFNRCKVLANALTSVAGQEFADFVTWEVLVVDNGSTDQTSAVVTEFCQKYPDRFSYLFEPQSGKSNALNSGIRQARGHILAFIDDDVILEPTWLANLTFRLRTGSFVGAGGRVLPKWDRTPPKWFPKSGRFADGPLVAFDLGTKSEPLLEPPYGTNMAFLREVFERHGKFRTDLGPRPNSEIRGEDTEFALRLFASGEKLSYEPTAIVYHPVPEYRLQKEFFLRWWFDKARADVRTKGISNESTWRVYGIPLVMFRRLIVWTVRWLVSLEPSQRFSCKINVWISVGRILECYQHFSDAKKEVGATAP